MQGTEQTAEQVMNSLRYENIRLKQQILQLNSQMMHKEFEALEQEASRYKPVEENGNPSESGNPS